MWTQPVDKTKPKGKTRFFESARNPVDGSYKTFSVTMDGCSPKYQKLAVRALDERRQAFLLSTQAKSDTELTFHDLVTAFNESRKHDPDIRESTQRQAIMKLRPVERLIGEDTKVENLTAGYIRSALLKSGADAVCLNGYLKILKVILRWGYKNDYISDVSYLAKIPKWKEETPYHERIQDHYLERDELSQLLDGFTDGRYILLTKFLVLSGLRLGEAIALEKSDVQFESRRIRVTKSMQSITHIIDLPKNSTSYREIYMQDELLEVCRQIDSYVWTDKRTNIFMPNINGDYMKHETVEKYFRKNSEKILGRRITPHMLRHTHVSLIVEAALLSGQKISLDDIAERLGHANSRITKEIYFHKTNLVREEVNKRFNKLKLL